MLGLLPRNHASFELFIGGFREPRLFSRIVPQTEAATSPDLLPTPVFACLDEAVDPSVALVHGPVNHLLEKWGAGSQGQKRYSLRIAAAWIVQTKVQKWGNSLGVRIPRVLAEEVGFGAGTEVSLTAKDGELVLRPFVPSRLRLADLLADVTPENIHACIDTGDSVGAEAF